MAAANYKIAVEHFPPTLDSDGDETESESWGFRLSFAGKGYQTAADALDASQPFYEAASRIDGGDSWRQMRFDFGNAHADVTVDFPPNRPQA